MLCSSQGAGPSNYAEQNVAQASPQDLLSVFGSDSDDPIRYTTGSTAPLNGFRLFKKVRNFSFQHKQCSRDGPAFVISDVSNAVKQNLFLSKLKKFSLSF